MNRVAVRHGNLKLYRVRRGGDNPIVSWEPREDDPMDPHLRITFASGHTVVAPLPKKTLADAGVVVLFDAWSVPGIPIVTTDPEMRNSDLTDRKDVVELVVSWAEDYDRRQRERQQAATSARRQR